MSTSTESWEDWARKFYTLENGMPIPTDEPTGTWADHFKMEELRRIAEVVEFNWRETFGYATPSPNEYKLVYVVGLLNNIFYAWDNDGIELESFPQYVQDFYNRANELELQSYEKREEQ